PARPRGPRDRQGQRRRGLTDGSHSSERTQRGASFGSAPRLRFFGSCASTAPGWFAPRRDGRPVGPMSFGDAFEPPRAPQGRVPPHSLDAERAVLGGIMLENNALNAATQILGVDDFYSRANALIFEAMCELFRRGEPVDLVTLRAWLVDRGNLQKAGGDEHMLALTETIPTVENIEHHAAIVRDKAIVRRLITRCHEIAAQGYGEYGDVKEFVDESEKKIFEVAKEHKRAPYEPIKDVVIRTFEQVTAA